MRIGEDVCRDGRGGGGGWWVGGGVGGLVFFFNDTATTEIYTLSLHDALPILIPVALAVAPSGFVDYNVSKYLWISGKEN